MTFTKMHGIGNDFVMVDAVSEAAPHGDLAELSREVCDRKFGVGADGLILALRGQAAPFAMRMFNPDGSESEMCGNGVRCFALFLRDNGLTEAATIPVETGAGLLTLEVTADGRVRVDMGPARLTRGEIGMTGTADEQFVAQPVPGTERLGTAVSMGNPHLVVFVPDVEAVDLVNEGRALEHHALFPKRVNVHFVQVLSRTHLRQRTWERGAGATLACGTGACAVAVAGFLNGLSERVVTISLPGGDLSIECGEDGRVFMTGPAETVFVGRWPSSQG